MPGYWGYHFQGCRCCKSGPKQKFACAACDHVCKAPWDDFVPRCPFCREPMVAMGHRWRPGKKGRRVIPPPRRHRIPSPGEALLARLKGGA
jgi:hypothetical protein